MITSQRIYYFYSDLITEMNKYIKRKKKSFTSKKFYRWIIALEQSKLNYYISYPEKLREGSVSISNPEKNLVPPVSHERGYI